MFTILYHYGDESEVYAKDIFGPNTKQQAVDEFMKQMEVHGRIEIVTVIAKEWW